MLRLTQLTARLLETKQAELQLIKWTDSEANTDIGFSELACKCCLEAYATMAEPGVTLTVLPPDINLTFTQNGLQIKEKIELKSSKGLYVPGSTIGKLDIAQPLIYCLRPNDPNGTYKFRYSQYYSSLGESDHDLFQDRTPRPAVNYTKMSDVSVDLTYVQKDKGDWVEHYAKCALKRTEDGYMASWQDIMVKKLIKMSIDSYLKNTSIEEIQARRDALISRV